MPSASAFPPDGETRSKRVPDVLSGENTIMSSSLHAPPRVSGAGASVWAAPPVTAIFFSCAIGEKPDPESVGRKERTDRVLGAGQRHGLQLIESQHVKLATSARDFLCLKRDNVPVAARSSSSVRTRC